MATIVLSDVPIVAQWWLNITEEEISRVLIIEPWVELRWLWRLDLPSIWADGVQSFVLEEWFSFAELFSQTPFGGLDSCLGVSCPDLLPEAAIERSMFPIAEFSEFLATLATRAYHGDNGHIYMQDESAIW